MCCISPAEYSGFRKGGTSRDTEGIEDETPRHRGSGAWEGGVIGVRPDNH